MSSLPWTLGKLAAAAGANEALRGDFEALTFGDLAALEIPPLEVLPPRSRILLVAELRPVALAVLFLLWERGHLVALARPKAEAEMAARVAVFLPDFVVAIEQGEIDVTAGPGGDWPSLLAQMRTDREAGLILFSSGSTGEPKAVVHRAASLFPPLKARPGRGLRVTALLLFDHIGGLNTILQTWAKGQTLVIPPARDAEVVAATVAAHRAQVLPATPTFLNLLLTSGALERHDLSSLRLITYGTEAMPPALLTRLKATLPRVRFHQSFGTSETGIHATRTATDDGLSLRFDDPSLETRVVDGQLWLRSAHAMVGYLNAAEKRDADGWFPTGDVVETRPDGTLRLVGRVTDLINVGGDKVLPGEVENTLLAMSEVAGARVLGAPHALTGQTVVAEVVVADGVDATSLSRAVRRWCAARLEPHKVPSKVRVVAEIPRSARMKLDRRASHAAG